MEVMEETCLSHRWIRRWIRISGKGSKFPSCMYRKQLYMNKCYAAALPGLLGLSESAVLDQRFIQTELRMIKTAACGVETF